MPEDRRRCGSMPALAAGCLWPSVPPPPSATPCRRGCRSCSIHCSRTRREPAGPRRPC